MTRSETAISEEETVLHHIAEPITKGSLKRKQLKTLRALFPASSTTKASRSTQ